MISDHTITPKRKFPHCFIVREIDPHSRQEIIDWLKENYGKYGHNYIYWGVKLSPKRPSHRIEYYDPLEFYIKNEQDAFAFKMRWA